MIQSSTRVVCSMFLLTLGCAWCPIYGVLEWKTTVPNLFFPLTHSLSASREWDSFTRLNSIQSSKWQPFCKGKTCLGPSSTPIGSNSKPTPFHNLTLSRSTTIYNLTLSRSTTTHTFNPLSSYNGSYRIESCGIIWYRIVSSQSCSCPVQSEWTLTHTTETISTTVTRIGIGGIRRSNSTISHRLELLMNILSCFRSFSLTLSLTLSLSLSLCRPSPCDACWDWSIWRWVRWQARVSHSLPIWRFISTHYWGISI